MQPLISVIVPVYRVEAYLDRCVRSIVDQTYQNLEIILVDDGSPDRCPALCDAWAEKDSRVRVVHKENGGLSDARNAGMAVATGELMGFIDSDDWIEPEMYALLYEHMEQDGADLAACGVQMEWEDESRMLTASGSCVLTREEAMEALLQESWLKQPVWYKLYRTALIRDIPFAVGRCHEDVFWSYQAVAAAGKVTVFDTPCYHYLQRSGSIMGAEFSPKRLDMIRGQLQRLDFLEKNFQELTLLARKKLIFSCLYQYQMFDRCPPSAARTEAQRFLLETAAQVRLTPAQMGQLSRKNRFWVRCARLSFAGTCKLRNALKIGV